MNPRMRTTRREVRNSRFRDTMRNTPPEESLLSDLGPKDLPSVARAHYRP